MSPFYRDAVQAHVTLKHKIKAIIRMVRNYVASVIKGKGILVVAGREPNHKLVSMTSEMITESTGLKVREIIREDCG